MAESGGKQTAGARILVAEDDAPVREFVIRALEHMGHDVLACEDGYQALAELEARDGAFDMVLSDIAMPGLDGIALALKVSKSYPGIQILLMSGYAAERQRAHNLDVLSHTVLAKPFSLVEFRDAVERVLASAPQKSA